MAEAPRPHANGCADDIIEDMIEDMIIENSLVTDLNTFDKHEQKIMNNSETNLDRTTAEKRARESSDEQDGFTVVRSKAKKKKELTNQNSENGERRTPIIRETEYNKEELIEVCIASDKPLPKQIGLAKLLKSENIPNIYHVKFKTPYKAYLRFGTRDEALLLVNNKKMQELGYRCRLTNEVTVTYGVVKYVEMELDVAEIMDIFESEAEILSVKRLKRLDDSKWCDSETVRFCFASPTLPLFVYGYGSRFKVEPFTFPVTQCSICWRYGHIARVCPSKRIKCPKCGGEHPNCEISEDKFKCSNCQGNHIAFNKKCPTFLKEKAIRHGMCKNNCTYKVALENYRSEHQTPTRKENNYNLGGTSPVITMNPRRWETINQKGIIQNEIITTAEIHQESIEVIDECDSEDKSSTEGENIGFKINQKKKRQPRKKKISKKTNNLTSVTMESEPEGTEESRQNEKTEKVHQRRKETDKFKNMVTGIQKIFSSGGTFADKVQQILHLIFDEAMKYLMKAVSNGDLIRKLIGLNNG